MGQGLRSLASFPSCALQAFVTQFVAATVIFQRAIDTYCLLILIIEIERGNEIDKARKMGSDRERDIPWHEQL